MPVGLWGTEKVWPRSAKVPNVTNLLHPPVVRVKVGRPFHVVGDDLDADTQQIMDAISGLLPRAARRHRIPSRDELAATYPSGEAPADLDKASGHEASRRPGSD